MQCGKAGTFGRVGEGVIRELAQLLGNAGMWWDAQLPIIAQIWVTMVMMMMMMMMMMIRMMIRMMTIKITWQCRHGVKSCPIAH